MIKGNELDVGKIDFEFQAKRGDRFLCFTMFLIFEMLFMSLQADVRLRDHMGFGSNCSISKG